MRTEPVMPYRDWHDAMVTVAEYAQSSPDRSTQNGAVLWLPEGVANATYAVNRFPYGVIQWPERWERPEKYQYVEHAERGSIYKAAMLGIPTAGATMVCPFAACTDCARAIICSGIKRLVTMDTAIIREHSGDNWNTDGEVAEQMLREAGVTVEYIRGPLGVDLLRNGKMVTI